MHDEDAPVIELAIQLRDEASDVTAWNLESTFPTLVTLTLELAAAHDAEALSHRPPELPEDIDPASPEAEKSAEQVREIGTVYAEELIEAIEEYNDVRGRALVDEIFVILGIAAWRFRDD